MLNFPGKMLTRIFVTGERLIIRSWKPAPFLKMKKAGILMASRHKNPGRFKNDNFLKTLYKISALFQISSENKKGAAQSLRAYGWYSSKDASQRVCIYGTVKNRVHILPLIFKLISVDFSWNYPKKRFRCNLFQVASKVLNKHGAASQIWTDDHILAKGELRFINRKNVHIPIILPHLVNLSNLNYLQSRRDKPIKCLP